MWSLLDAGGAAARWLDVRLVDRSTGPAGPIARTVLRHRGSRVECWDALVDGGCGPALVRLARTGDVALSICHELALGGFDRAPGRWEGACWRSGELTVEVTGGTSIPMEGGRLRTELRAPAGRWAAVVIGVGGVGGVVGADPQDLAERLLGLERRRGDLLRRAQLPRHHPERGADALDVLEMCTYRPTGAVVAAATTSLPEAPGADRQFDYRYTWLRDASLGISVAALLGHRQAAERYLTFVRGLGAADDPPEAPMTDVRGRPAPPERTVEGVAGWAGSQPVRVGNSARDQIQLDSPGLLVEGISVYLQTGGTLDGGTWRLVQAIADRAAGVEPGRPTSGIWEMRTPQDLLSADIGRWLSLDRAVWIARGWRPWARRRHWISARARARERVVGALQPDGGLPQVYGGPPESDASALMVVVFGMLDRRDPRATALVRATLAELDAGPFLYRYEPGGDDGFAGREGAFVPVCWWAVSALATIGCVEEAVERADRLCAALPRLLSEEVDPATGESLGNVPLVWAHAEAARAMYVLDAATIRARFGSAALWAWRMMRYARLRWPNDAGPTEDDMAERQR